VKSSDSREQSNYVAGLARTSNRITCARGGRAAGVVVSRRDKLLVYYRLAMPKIIDLLDEVARFLKSNPSPA
jgi:hypothetical protein